MQMYHTVTSSQTKLCRQSNQGSALLGPAQLLAHEPMPASTSCSKSPMAALLPRFTSSQGKGCWTGDAQSAPTVPLIPERPGLVIQGGEVFKVLGLLLALWMVLVLKWLRPSFLGLLGSTALGTGVGFGLVFLFFYNTRRKVALNDGVRCFPAGKRQIHPFH